MPSRARRQDLLGYRDSAEQILYQEVSRVLRKMDPSPEVVEGIERLGCTLTDRIFSGPIAEVMARLEKRTCEGGPGGDRAVLRGGTTPRETAHRRRGT